MALAFGISAYSLMEGIYLPEDLAKLAKHLGYTDLALVDRGLHGFPRMREAAEQAGLRLHVGTRLPLEGGEAFVLPLERSGYTAMNKSLTDLAHGRPWSWPEGCALIGQGWEAVLRLRDAAPDPALVHLLIDRSGWQLSLRARAEGIPVVGPQVLRFWKPEGLALHKVKRAIALNRVLRDLRPSEYWEPRLCAQTFGGWEAGLSQEAIEGTRRLEAMLGHWSLE